MFEWAKRPPTGHPGEDYNCRCFPEPTLDGAGDPRVEVANAAAAIAAGVVFLLNIRDKANKVKKVVDAARATDVLINTLPEDEEEQEEAEEEESEDEATEDRPEDGAGEPEKEPGDEEPEGEKPDGENVRTAADIADKIANGHAYDKHVIEEDKFPEISSKEELRALVEDIIENPDDVRELERGRKAYWDDETGTIVIENPNDPDGGSVFRPDKGRDYFENDIN